MKLNINLLFSYLITCSSLSLYGLAAAAVSSVVAAVAAEDDDDEEDENVKEDFYADQ